MVSAMTTFSKMITPCYLYLLAVSFKKQIEYILNSFTFLTFESGVLYFGYLNLLSCLSHSKLYILFEVLNCSPRPAVMQGFFVFSLLCIGATLAFSRQDIVQREFAAFKAKYNKTYDDYDEEVARYEIFRYNFEAVRKQNKMMRSYTVGINQFSDLTHQEFKDQYLGYSNPSKVHSLNTLPDSFVRKVSFLFFYVQVYDLLSF